jgi:hypothetical protein
MKKKMNWKKNSKIQKLKKELGNFQINRKQINSYKN